MARIRSIKPGFFTNEHLAELGPWHRLCFAGLWVLADREGRLEDRPRRIKAALFPYDDLDADALLVDLEGAGFIARYVAENLECIQILQFHKHQRPKKDEHASALPSMLLAEPRGKVTDRRLGHEDIRELGNRDIRDSADAAGASVADGADEFKDLWNTLTTPPIARCRDLTAKRRRSIKARLAERPLTEWAEVFERIEASVFCRGTNDRGWAASFDWVIGSPDVAVKVLEGKYDNRKPATPQPTARAVMGLVPQSPEMDDYHAQMRASRERQAAERAQKASA